MRVVLRQGMNDLEARNEAHLTAFLWACHSRSVECIGLLAEAGCDKDAVTYAGGTALMGAAWSKEAAAVRAVLCLTVKDKEARDEDGATAFLIACNTGSAECIAMLAEAGCDKDAVSDAGVTALMQAAFSKEAAAVRAVLDLGAGRKLRLGGYVFTIGCQQGVPIYHSSVSQKWPVETPHRVLP